MNLSEHIDLAHPERYILTIEVHPKRFGIGVYSPIQDGSYHYVSIKRSSGGTAASDFQDIYYDNEFLSLPFRKVIILNCTADFTLIPTHIFDEKNEGDYMDFLFSHPTGRLMHHELMLQSVTVLHGMDEDLHNFLFRSFLNPQLYHHSAPLISYFSNPMLRINAKRMIISIEADSIDLVCFEQDRLLLVNRFSISSLKEAIYYLLFVWKQLGFDQLKDYAHIAGNMQGRKELMSGLKEYFRHIIPVNITPKAHLEQVDILTIPFPLIALTLCEL